MSHRKNRNRIAERQRAKQVERGDMIDKMMASPWFTRRARNLSAMLRFNTRWVLAMAAGFTIFQGVGPWTNSLADHAVFLLIGIGFIAGLLAHWRYIG